MPRLVREGDKGDNMRISLPAHCQLSAGCDFSHLGSIEQSPHQHNFLIGLQCNSIMGSFHFTSCAKFISPLTFQRVSSSRRKEFLAPLLPWEKRSLGYLLCRTRWTFGFGIFKSGKVLTAGEWRWVTWGLSQDLGRVRKIGKKKFF